MIRLREKRSVPKRIRIVFKKSAHAGVYALLASALLLQGCATKVSRAPADWPEPAEPTVVLQPGDVLKVKFAYWPELDEEQAIRPDGKVSLQLIGEIIAEGLTPEEFRDQLLEVYDGKIVNPEINVVLSSLDSQRIYVGGEVNAPGLIPFKGRLTVLEAVMQAGGFMPTAKASSVIVIRRKGDAQYARKLNLREHLGQSGTAPFFLEPYDVVFIPRSNIDHVDQWVDQYINKIVPRNLHYNFSTILGDRRDSSPRRTTTRTQPLQFQLSTTK